MIALFASIFALGIGPLIYQSFGPMKRTDSFSSGFILVVITSTLAFDVLPHTFERIGSVAIILATLGFIGPTLVEKLFSKSADKTHILTISLGILGLILHASIDGAAIQTATQSTQSESLNLAIVLHRLPVGLTIWWLLNPLIGQRWALLTLFFMALATSGGYFLSMLLETLHSSQGFLSLQAFIAGSLMHVILHKPHDDGCLHTSHSHSHSHSIIHSHSDTDSDDQIEKKSKPLLNSWEWFGALLGVLTILAIHRFI